MTAFIEPVMRYAHALAVAVLVGKVVLLSFVVAPILAKQLGPDQFGPVVRRLFPALLPVGHGRGDGRTPVAARDWIPARAERVGAGSRRDLGGDSSRRVLLSFAADSTKQRDAGSAQEQEQQGDVDPVLQAAWTRLHQRSLCLNSLVLIGGLCLVGMIRQFS